VKRGRNHATVKIEHRNVIRAGVSNIGTVAVGRNIDEEGPSVDADGGNDLILFRVDYTDIRRAGVNNINFVSLGISRDSGGLSADLQSANWAEATQVDNCNCVALAVRDVSILAVERAVAGESALVKVIPSGGKNERNEDGE
jgi:hypothetical protein